MARSASWLLIAVVIILINLRIEPVYSAGPCTRPHEYAAGSEIRDNRRITYCKCEQGFHRYLGNCVADTTHKPATKCDRYYDGCLADKKKRAEQDLVAGLSPEFNLCVFDYLNKKVGGLPAQAASYLRSKLRDVLAKAIDSPDAVPTEVATIPAQILVRAGTGYVDATLGSVTYCLGEEQERIGNARLRYGNALRAGSAECVRDHCRSSR